MILKIVAHDDFQVCEITENKQLGSGGEARRGRRLGQAMTGKNRIIIYGPKTDGTYVVEFRTAAGEALAISIPRTEAAVIHYFQERMPYGLFVPDLGAKASETQVAATWAAMPN